VAQTEDQKRLAAFESMLRVRSGQQLSEQVRYVLNATTDAQGGYTVPEVYLTSVIEKLNDVSVMRQNSDVIRTTSLTRIPLGGDDPVFAIIAENGQYAENDLSFDQLSLDAYKQGGIIKASDELITDSFLNIQDYITKKMVRGIESKEEEYFTTGTGSNQPTGIITGAALGKTTASASGVTTDEVLEFIASVKAG
ncbi:MAG: phage major capsid protein, partial [Alteromonadales bacterium]|nr:phage major capsid protein [Alteromonadales bacterium]